MSKEGGAATPGQRWPAVVSAILIVAGIASIVLAVLPAPVLPHMVALALLALVSAVGLYRGARWGIPLSLIAIALYAVAGLATTYVFWTLYAALRDAAFAAGLGLSGLLTALALLLFLYLLSRRGRGQEKGPQSG